MLFVLGTFQVALILLAQSLLEGSVREAARYGITGYVYSGYSREQIIKSIVGQYTVGLVDMDKVTVTSVTYSSFTDVGQPEPFNDANHNGVYDPGESFDDVNGNGKWDADMGIAGAGGPGDVVVYTVSYDWPLWFGYVAKLFSDTGYIRLQASYAVRNEPWTSGGGS